MLAPGLVPALCSCDSVIGGRETLFDEDVLHHQRDRRCRLGCWSNSMRSPGPRAGHVSRSDRMIHRGRTHVTLDRILGPARRRHTGNHRNRHRLVRRRSSARTSTPAHPRGCARWLGRHLGGLPVCARVRRGSGRPCSHAAPDEPSGAPRAPPPAETWRGP